MPHVKVNEIDIYFELHGGEGEPLVFVHGYTGDVTDWRHQIPEFSATHRVLVVDNRGHGRSHAPRERETYNVIQMASDLEGVIDEVGFERYHLVGHSMGGAISQEIALKSPGRLMSLTIEDSGHSFEMNPTVLQYLEKRYEIAEQHGMEAVANLPGLPPPPHATEARRAEEKARLERMSIDGFIGAWRGLTSWRGSSDRLHQIQTPTLVIYGELDTPLVAGAKHLAANIPGAELEMIPEAAHSPQFERPDLFNGLVRRHLDRHAGGPAK
jgi:pimeloyl-ACP methyl ester carboxylesterase